MIYQKRQRVLLVDDHQVVVEAVKSLLEAREGFEVVGCALDAAGALALVESVVPDIVVMDISMPGLEVVKAVRELRERFPDTWVVIFTMFSDRDHILSLYKAGVSGYVLKEQPVSELISALETVSEGGVFYSKQVQQIVRDYMESLGKEAEEPSVIDAKLSKREREVLPLLADGLSVNNIADRLCISPKTVESHKYNILQKLELGSIAELTKLAIRKGLITL